MCAACGIIHASIIHLIIDSRHVETPRCGDVFLQHRGEFSSLNFPDRYPRQTRCVWKISTDPNRRIALGIINNDFNVEVGSNHYSCDYDSVSVFDGTNKNSRSLGRFCGNIDFPRTFRTVFSTTSNLYIEFKSDHIVEKSGFRLQYSVFFAGNGLIDRCKAIITIKLDFDYSSLIEFCMYINFVSVVH